MAKTGRPRCWRCLGRGYFCSLCGGRKCSWRNAVTFCRCPAGRRARAFVKKEGHLPDATGNLKPHPHAKGVMVTP